VLKRFEDDDRPEEDAPLMHWAMQDALARCQDAFYGLFQNLPGRFLPGLLRFVSFPWGRIFDGPTDRLGSQVCSLVLTPGRARDRLTSGIYIGEDGPIPTLEAALLATIEAEPLEQKLRAADRHGMSATDGTGDDLTLAVAQGVLTRAQMETVARARALRRKAIMVDDFPKDLGRTEIYQTTEPVRPPTRTKAQPV
jgi:acyl-CoA dehydrogenase